MHLNWAFYNACNLDIHLYVCFLDFVTVSVSDNPVSTARGLSATQREACLALAHHTEA